MNHGPRPYTVVGAGAIGGTIAWHLARAGHPVTVVDTDADHVAAIARDGLVLERDGVRAASPSRPRSPPRRWRAHRYACCSR